MNPCHGPIASCQPGAESLSVTGDTLFSFLTLSLSYPAPPNGELRALGPTHTACCQCGYRGTLGNTTSRLCEKLHINGNGFRCFSTTEVDGSLISANFAEEQGLVVNYNNRPQQATLCWWGLLQAHTTRRARELQLHFQTCWCTSAKGLSDKTANSTITSMSRMGPRRAF